MVRQVAVGFALGCAMPAHAAVVHAVKEWNFASGLHVLFADDTRFPVTRVVVGIDAGSADSPADRKQLAHLVEHLWFRSQVDGVENGSRLDAMGCAWNATTRWDVTTYQSQCASDSFEAQLTLMLGVLGASFGGLDQDRLDTEKRVVTQELRVRGDGLWLPLLGAAERGLFPLGSAYHQPATVEEAVGVCTLDDVHDFTRTHYVPRGATIVVSGDVDRSVVARVLQAALPPSALHPDLTPAHRRAFEADAVRFLGGNDDAPVAWYVDPVRPDRPLGFAPAELPQPGQLGAPLAPAMQSLDVDAFVEDPAVAVAWSIPGTDPFSYWPTRWLETLASADLASTLAGTKGVLASGCVSRPGRWASTLTCMATYDDKGDPEAIAASMAGAFGGTFTFRRELQVRALVEGFDGRSEETVERDAGGLDTAEEIALNRMMTGVPTYYPDRYNRSAATELARYRELVASYLLPGRAVTIQVHPVVEDELGAAASLGRFDVAVPQDAAVPVADLSPSVSPVLAARTERTLRNGLHVVDVPVSGLALSYWVLVFPHPPGFSAELAPLVDAQLSPPARWGGQPLPYRLPPLVPGTDYAVQGFRVVGSSDLEALATTLRATFEGVRLSRPGADRVRQRKLEILGAWRRATYWADNLVHEAFTGRPLGAMPDDVDAAAALSSEAVQAYVDAKFRPDNATLVVVGRYDDARLTAALDGDLRRWEASGVSAAALTTPRSVWQPSPVAWVVTEERPTQVADVSLACPLDLGDATGAEVQARLDVLQRVLYGRVWSTLRAGAGAVYTPGVVARERWGGADVVLQAPVGVADLGGSVQGLRDAVAWAAAGEVSEGLLATARRRALDAVRVGLDSDLAVSRFLGDRAGRGLSTADADTYGGALAAVDGRTLAAMLAPCAGHDVLVVSGAGDAVSDALTRVGIAAGRLDWRAAFLDRVGTWFPARLELERRRL